MIGSWLRRQPEPIRFGAPTVHGPDSDIEVVRAQLVACREDLRIAHNTMTRQARAVEFLTGQNNDKAAQIDRLDAQLAIARGELAAAQAEPKPAVVVEERDPAHWRRRAILAEANCLRYERVLAGLRDRDPEHKAVAGTGPVWGGP